MRKEKKKKRKEGKGGFKNLHLADAFHQAGYTRHANIDINYREKSKPGKPIYIPTYIN